MPVVILIAALILGGGITSAERALPGDFLYPIKVNVNEPVVGLISFTGTGKAEWDARIAERRLEEIERLASESRLSDDVRARLQENFVRYADRVSDRLEKMKDSNAKGASEVSAQFSSSLRAHHIILERFVFESGEKEFLDVLKQKFSDIENRKSESDEELKKAGEPANRSAANGKIKAAKNKIEEVIKYIERKKELLGEEATSEALSRLEEATKALGNAESLFQAGEYFSAFTLSRDAHGLAQEAKLLVETSERLESIEDDEDTNEAEEEDEDEKDGAKSVQGIECTEEYRPVCGTNGKTYGNACRARVAGVVVKYEGSCRPEQVVCTEEYDPVCGGDGKTYSNVCVAKNAGVGIKYKGACEKEQFVCTQEYAPVCGRDGKTYGNSCLAKAGGAEVVHDGPCGQGGQGASSSQIIE